MNAEKEQRKLDEESIDACSNYNLEIVKELLAKGADVSTTTSSGYTPLHLACSKSNLKMIAKLLLDNGANVNTTNEDGDTPLSI
jgi:serine/threonine-protein phosphatase 6 regulatory ankyrin repeat subunit B